MWVNRRLTTRQLFGYNWHVLAAVLMIAAALNPIGIITQKNITERANREQQLDTFYLNRLSEDSYPAVCRYAPMLKSTHSKEYDALLIERYTRNPYLPYQEKRNHGLSAHYTMSESYKKQYYCLK